MSEEPAAEAGRCPYRLERISRKLLRHKTYLRPCRAIIAQDIATVHKHLPRAWSHNATDNADECRFAGSVWPQQGKDLSLTDLEIDGRQRGHARSVGLTNLRYRNDRSHRRDHTASAA